MRSLQGLREVIERPGLFSSLYVDRGSHYWYPAEAGGTVDTTRLTQVHHALRQLGITLIAAYSPAARGRSERVVRTLQDRLPQEVALGGITDRAAANQYLGTEFLSADNRRFAVPAPEVGTAVVPWIGTNLADVRCIPEERVVANDNTGRYQRLHRQIPPARHRFHSVTVTVRGHEYPEGTLAVFHGPRCVARYDAEGQLREPAPFPQLASARPQARTPRRSSVSGQVGAKYFRRAAANNRERTNRTDHVLPPPDNLTCYLQNLR